LKHTYKNATAFRSSLEDRLRNRAQNEGLDLQWLRRQVAFERLLARIFHQPDTVWLLKGGYAMELRLRQQARTTLDIDLMIADIDTLRLITAAKPNEQTINIAFDHLQELGDIDLGDFFQYVIARPKQVTTAPAGGLRCSVDCRLDGRTFAKFHIDIGLGDLVLGEPEWLPGRAVETLGMDTPTIPLLPVTQQIAEKFHVYTFPWTDRANTRVKDLIDLILLFETQELDKDVLQETIRATFRHRNTHPVPETLPKPPADWHTVFEALAQQLALPIDTLEEGFEYIAEKWHEWALGKKPA